jgi:hypothetical protein
VRCTTELEVWSLANTWKAELLAQRWYPFHRAASTHWRSRHGDWSLFLSMPSYQCSDYGFFSGIAKWVGEGPYPTDLFHYLRIAESEPTLHLAQAEAVRRLAEQTGHVCSDRCTPWTFELQVQPEMEPPS